MNYKFEWHGPWEDRVVCWRHETRGKDHRYHPSLEEARDYLWNNICRQIEDHRRDIRVAQKALKNLEKEYDRRHTGERMGLPWISQEED